MSLVNRGPRPIPLEPPRETQIPLPSLPPLRRSRRGRKAVQEYARICNDLESLAFERASDVPRTEVTDELAATLVQRWWPASIDHEALVRDVLRSFSLGFGLALAEESIVGRPNAPYVDGHVWSALCHLVFFPAKAEQPTHAPEEWAFRMGFAVQVGYYLARVGPTGAHNVLGKD